MAESESNPKWPTPDMSVAASGFSAASKTMKVFVDELAQITQKNFTQTTKIIEELQAARNIGDLLSIQSKFVQETFEAFNERLHRMSALMAELPNEFAQAGQGMAEAGAEVAKEAVQQAADAVSKTVAAVTNTTGEAPPH
ncbi:MAG: phasin family protein [Beijerinckiaceae bacterium]